MRDILNKIRDGVLIADYNGIIKFCNSKLLCDLEYRSDISGKSISEIFQGNNIYEMFNKYINRNIDEEYEEDVECIFTINSYKCRRKKYRIEMLEKEWYSEAVVYIFVKECEDERYSKKDLESFLYDAPFICAIKDLNDKYIFANKACLHAFNVGNEVIGKSHYEIFGETTTKRDLEEDKEVAKSKKTKIYYKQASILNSEPRWLETHKVPVYDEMDKIKLIVKMGRDITLRKKLSNELTESYTKLQNIENITKINSYTNRLKLGSFQKDMLNLFCAEGIEIYIFEEIKEVLESRFKVGICEYLDSKEETLFRIKKEEFLDMMINDRYEELKVLENEKNNYIKNKLKSYGINYQYIYKIHFNEDVLGVLIAYYKNENDIHQIDKEEIKRLCEQIGIIVKNEKLSIDIAAQFQKRLDIEKELEDFLYTGVDMMILIDEDGKIIKANDEVSKILGWNKDEFVALDSRNIVHPEDLENTINAIRTCKGKANTVFTFINRNIHKNGDFIWLDWRFKYIEERKLIISTARNVTNIKILEESRAEYEKALQLESIKNEFFANISHEFKTPLNIILSTMQLINRGIDNNTIKVVSNVDFTRYRKSIVQNSYRLLRLVNNLIDLTRIDTGFYNLNLENYNIVSIVEDITESVVQYVSEKGITLIFDTDIEEEVIACDPDKIERIMLNLLSNAIKYTSDTGKIDVTINNSTNYIFISVKDDGIGIPDSKLETIFDRFVQVDNTLTRTCEGSGIGLSLVKSLVNLHDGEIFVTSKLGEGTEFVFSIPKKQSDSEIKTSECNLNSKIEKCNIEFSDIYSV